jgi:hypothetical protein
MEASRMVEMIDKYKQNSKKIEPLLPLPIPYSVIEIPRMVERILPNHYSTITYDMCLSCGSSGDIDKMLYCCDCGECYHSYCIGEDGTIYPEMRSGWRCTNCKICEICGLSVTKIINDTNLICKCSYCTRTFHKSCLHYNDESNQNLFVCGHCFNCIKCGEKGTNINWSYHRQYCRNCYEKEERFHQCAICNKPWNDSDLDMTFCENCEQWIHRRCIDTDYLEWYKCFLTRTPYNCKKCRQKIISIQSKTSINQSISNINTSNEMIRSLVSTIQDQRQRIRIKEILQQNNVSMDKRNKQLEPYWKDFVMVILRV